MLTRVFITIVVKLDMCANTTHILANQIIITAFCQRTLTSTNLTLLANHLMFIKVLLKLLYC